jgi:hypothetical protein
VAATRDIPGSAVLALLLFELGVPFRISAFFSEPFASVRLHPSAKFWVGIAPGVTPGCIRTLSFLRSLSLKFTRH